MQLINCNILTAPKGYMVIFMLSQRSTPAKCGAKKENVAIRQRKSQFHNLFAKIVRLFLTVTSLILSCTHVVAQPKDRDIDADIHKGFRAGTQCLTAEGRVKDWIQNFNRLYEANLYSEFLLGLEFGFSFKGEELLRTKLKASDAEIKLLAIEATKARLAFEARKNTLKLTNAEVITVLALDPAAFANWKKSVSTADKDESDLNTTLAHVFSWVSKTGVSTVVRAHVASACGLGQKDISVREKGFREKGERFTHVFAVVIEPSMSGNVFFAQIDEADGSGVTWYCSPWGQLISTILLHGGMTAISTDNRNLEFELAAEKRYFLRKFAQYDKNAVEHSRIANRFPLAEVGGQLTLKKALPASSVVRE
jgi:hypothetical protein